MIIVWSILITLYIVSAIYYNYELVDHIRKNGWIHEFGKGIKSVGEFITFFLLGFIPLLNTTCALRLFKTRND